MLAMSEHHCFGICGGQISLLFNSRIIGIFWVSGENIYHIYRFWISLT